MKDTLELMLKAEAGDQYESEFRFYCAQDYGSVVELVKGDIDAAVSIGLGDQPHRIY